MYHHDFNNYDDSGKPQLIILKEFLVMICNRLKAYLNIPSLIPNRPPGNPGVKECLLTIGGGEIHEAERIKRSFSFYSIIIKKANKNICFNQPDLDYLYKQLFNNTIIFSSIIKNLDDAEEDPGLSLPRSNRHGRK
jgi:hypothetical protein